MRQIDIQLVAREVTVRFAGQTIAQTVRGLWLDETGAPLRYYFPPEDVRLHFLIPTSLHTACPYKGRASYWNVSANGRIAPEAAWSYLKPNPDCAAIADYLAFDPDRVDVAVAP